ncbi:MAG: tyrosine-type recombinase/integrase [Flavobacteriaceae bacterium]
MIEGFKDYLLLEKNYAALTVSAYERDLNAFVVFLQEYEVSFEDSTLLHISYDDVRAWIVHLLDQGMSRRSVNRKISALQTFYKYLLRIGELDNSPLEQHILLKINRTIEVPYSVEELENIQKLPRGNFEEARLALILELLYTTGMRRSELINLRVEDIDWSQQKLKVLGKGGKTRMIPLLDSTLDVLQDYISYRSKFAKDLSYLVLTDKGKKCYPNLVYRLINSYLSSVTSKQKKSPHMLRHSFATHMLDEGADLNTIKELLGHSSLSSTQVYTHSSLAKLKSVYNRSHPRRLKK